MVERLIPGGEGFARLPDGRTLFVPGGLPGDEVSVIAVHDRGSWARATEWSLLSAGPSRREPACELADRCGGCDWMALERTAQLEGKAAIVVDAMRRTGGLSVEPPAVQSVGDELGWRGRIRLTVSEDGRSVGFLARGSHEVVDVPRCPVATEAVNEGLAVVRAIAAEHGLRGVQGVELRSAPGGARISARVLTEGRPGPGALAVQRALPPETQSWPLPGGVSLSASPAAFTQVHDEANRALVQAVLDGVGAGEGCVIDACCGAGNFTLPLLARGLAVRAFDVSRDAIADLRRAAQDQGLVPEDVRAARMDSELRRLAREGLAVHAVVLDPPRKGAREAIPWLLQLAPRRIVYVACDPVSLARDSKALRKGGYELQDLRCVDLFPQTHHVETVAVFTKDRSSTDRSS